MSSNRNTLRFQQTGRNDVAQHLSSELFGDEDDSFLAEVVAVPLAGKSSTPNIINDFKNKPRKRTFAESMAAVAIRKVDDTDARPIKLAKPKQHPSTTQSQPQAAFSSTPKSSGYDVSKIKSGFIKENIPVNEEKLVSGSLQTALNHNKNNPHPMTLYEIFGECFGCKIQ